MKRARRRGRCCADAGDRPAATALHIVGFLSAVIAVILLPSAAGALETGHEPGLSAAGASKGATSSDAVSRSDASPAFDQMTLDASTTSSTTLLEEDSDVDEEALLLQLADETAAVSGDIGVLLELDSTGSAVVRHAVNVLGGAHVVRQASHRTSSWHSGNHLSPHEADGVLLDVVEEQQAEELRAAAKAAHISQVHRDAAAKEPAPALRGHAVLAADSTVSSAQHEAHVAFADAGAAGEAGVDADADADAEADAEADGEAGADGQHAGSEQWPSMASIKTAASNLFSKLKTFASDVSTGGLSNAIMNARSSLGIGQCPGRPVPCSGRGSCDVKCVTLSPLPSTHPPTCCAVLCFHGSQAVTCWPHRLACLSSVTHSRSSRMLCNRCLLPFISPSPAPSPRPCLDLPLPPTFPRRTNKCTCNKPWSGPGCDINRAYGRRSFFGCHLQPLPPAVTEVCNTAINVQHRCPGYRLLAYSLCNHTCPLVENFGCGVGNVSHVCADPLIKCPDLVRHA